MTDARHVANAVGRPAGSAVDAALVDAVALAGIVPFAGEIVGIRTSRRSASRCQAFQLPTVILRRSLRHGFDRLAGGRAN